MGHKVQVAKAQEFIDEQALLFEERIANDASEMDTFCMKLTYHVEDWIRDVAGKFGISLGDISSYALSEICRHGKIGLMDAGYTDVTTVGIYERNESWSGSFGYRFYRPFEYRI